jgi:hypothetical protein
MGDPPCPRGVNAFDRALTGLDPPLAQNQITTLIPGPGTKCWTTCNQKFNLLESSSTRRPESGRTAVTSADVSHGHPIAFRFYSLFSLVLYVHEGAPLFAPDYSSSSWFCPFARPQAASSIRGFGGIIV